VIGLKDSKFNPSDATKSRLDDEKPFGQLGRGIGTRPSPCAPSHRLVRIADPPERAPKCDDEKVA